MKLTKNQSLLLLVLGVVGIGLYLSLAFKTTSYSKYKTIYINNQLLTIEIADTNQLREKGLSSRKNLAPDQGMLFIFPTPAIYDFWMRDMLFPLDFIWINGDTIVDLTENVPKPPLSSDSQLPTYRPRLPVDYVLEVNSGIIKKLRVKIGDKIKINSIK